MWEHIAGEWPGRSNGSMNRGVLAAAIDEELGRTVNVNFVGHRFERRHPASCASTSLQNHRSPLDGSMMVRL